MSLIKKSFLLALPFLSYSSMCYAADPFVQQWAYFDGVNTYKLNIQPSDAPGQQYHIDYTFPGGYSATDMCTITSNTSFQCITGETITRDDQQHLVTLTARSAHYVFYDPKHMPDVNFVYGKWNYHETNKYTKTESNFDIAIRKTANPQQYDVTTTYTDNQGGICSFGDDGIIYNVVKNADGTELIMHGEGAMGYSFKYDPQKKQISNPNPGEPFRVGVCFTLDEQYSGSVIFTKVAAK